MSEKVLEKLNEQMNFEYLSAWSYKAMEIFAADYDLKGFEHWFAKQAQEEVEHAEKMKAFLLEVDYKPTLTDIKAPKSDFSTIEEAVNEAYEHEKEVTRRINEIAKLAYDEDERRVFSFIQWYIDEQVEEEDNFRYLLTRLERAKDNWGALYILDSELLRR